MATCLAFACIFRKCSTREIAGDEGQPTIAVSKQIKISGTCSAHGKLLDYLLALLLLSDGIVEGPKSILTPVAMAEAGWANVSS